MSYDIPSISELEAIQLLNKHYAEVITSKKDGVSSAADITQTTNPITGVTRRTLYKILDDAQAEHDNQMQSFENDFDGHILNMGFTRVGTFAAGATLTNPRQTLMWDIADGGDGQEYGWSGAFPKVIPAASTPASTGGISVGAWISRFDPELRVHVREALRRSYAEAGYNLVDGSFEAGGTVTSATDVLLYEATGIAYLWLGALPKVVPAGSTPASTGGIDLGAWVDAAHSNVEERLLGVGAKIYRGSNGVYVQNGDVVPAETTHLRVLINGKVENVAMSPVASGVVSLLTETSATIGSTSVNLLTLEQYRQFYSGKIDLKDWGVIADDSTDNSTELLFLRAVIKTKPHVRFEITHTDCNLVEPSAVIAYSSNWWLGGIREFVAKGLRLRCVYNGPLRHLKSSLLARGCFSASADNGLTRDLGELIESASRGDISVTLKTPANAVKFRPGASCFVYGLNSQVGGWPPNFKRFDYLTVKDSNPTTGVVSFYGVLENDYDSTWPDWSASDGDISAPRINTNTKFKSDGYPEDVQGNEYAEFINCTFEANTQGGAVPFNFGAVVRILTDCNIDNKSTYYAAQNSKFCKTTRLQTIGNGSEIRYEFDKNTKECIVEQPNNAFLDAATGVENLIIKGGTVKQWRLSPRRFLAENTNFYIDAGIGFRPYPSGNAIRSALFRGCTIDMSAMSGTEPPFLFSGRQTVKSGKWSSEGNGKIRILYSQNVLGDFVDLMCYMDPGVLCYFSAAGTQDAGLVSGFSIEAITKDLIVTLERTDQYATFDTASDLRFVNCGPELDGCTFPNSRAMQSSGKYPFGVSGVYGKREKVTGVYTEKDLFGSQNTNLTEVKRIKEIRINVTRSYTGVDNPNIIVQNLFGGAGGINQSLQISTAVVGEFTFNISNNASFFARIIQALRIYRQSNTSNDWTDPLLGPKFTMEIDYMPVV